MNYYAEIPDEKLGNFAAIRTAINTIIHQNTGFNPSESTLLTRQSAGILKEHPNDPKYDEMWDLRDLLNYYKEAPPPVRNVNLRLKANVLVRASVAGRNCDIAHIHRPTIKWYSDRVEFRLYKWKTQRFSKLALSNYIAIRKISDSRLCAFTALKEYMDVHELDYANLQCRSIWLSYDGLKPIVPSTLCTACRKFMIKIGIDPKYGGATLRHAAITFWRDMGISPQEVMNRTGH
jgi:hypothetical protein